MSRSYKKHPVCKDRNKGMKTIAARRFRRRTKLEDIPDGATYKKFFDQYSICDYKFRDTLGEYIKSHEKRIGRKIKKKEWYKLKNEWEKFYKRK